MYDILLVTHMDAFDMLCFSEGVFCSMSDFHRPQPPPTLSQNIVPMPGETALHPPPQTKVIVFNTCVSVSDTQH